MKLATFAPDALSDDLRNTRLPIVLDLPELIAAIIGLKSLLELDHMGVKILDKEYRTISKALHARLECAFQELTDPGAQG